MAKRRRGTSIDDVRESMLAALPDMVTLIVEQSWRTRRDSDEVTLAVGYRAHVITTAAGFSKSVESHSPADLYRKFVAEILPRLYPPAPRAKPGTGMIRAGRPLVIDPRSGEVVSDEHDLVGATVHRIETTARRITG